jgi:hypothetical protein
MQSMDSLQRFAADYLARHAGALEEADAREYERLAVDEAVLGTGFIGFDGRRVDPEQVATRTEERLGYRMADWQRRILDQYVDQGAGHG